MKLPELYIYDLACIETALLTYYKVTNEYTVKRLKKIKLILKFDFLLFEKYKIRICEEAAGLINERKRIETVVIDLLEKLNESTGKKEDQSLYLWGEMKKDIMTGKLSMSNKSL